MLIVVHDVNFTNLRNIGGSFGICNGFLHCNKRIWDNMIRIGAKFFVILWTESEKLTNPTKRKPEYI